MGSKYIILTLAVIIQVIEISAQGEQCITPYDVVGVCIERARCRSHLDLFYFDFVLFKNDLCSRSERFSNGRRFVCCTHPIIPLPPPKYPPIPPDVVSFGLPTTPLAAPQTLPQTPPSPTTTESTSTSTIEPQTTTPQAINTSPENDQNDSNDPNLQTTAPTTQANVPTTLDPLPQTTLQVTPEPSPQSTTQTLPTVVPTPNSSAPNSTDMSCSDPRGNDGFCCNMIDCPTLNIGFETKKYFFTYNEQYRVYIQQFTSICITHSEDFICCPKRKNTTDPSTTSKTTSTTTTTTTVAPPEPNIPFGRLLTPSEGCGYSNITHKQIADGNLAEPGTFPWIALLGYASDSGELTWDCAGSLITSRHILTAAHCLKNTLSTVRLGAHQINATNDDFSQYVKVIRAEAHPNYERFGIIDIAILHLERDVDATPEIRPICLPIDEIIRNRAFVGYLPFIAGWNLGNADGNTSNVLRELQVPVLNNDECKEQYQRQNKIVMDDQFGMDVICTGAYISGYDKCVSDSGSPLMQPIYNRDTRDDRYYQIGIISREIGCDQDEILDIYSRVQTFVDWIQDRVNNQ